MQPWVDARVAAEARATPVVHGHCDSCNVNPVARDLLLDGVPTLLYPGCFFQADDDIRVADVTGVQTCALPIYTPKNLIKNTENTTNMEEVFIRLTGKQLRDEI